MTHESLRGLWGIFYLLWFLFSLSSPALFASPSLLPPSLGNPRWGKCYYLTFVTHNTHSGELSAVYNVKIIHYPDGDRIILFGQSVLVGDDFAEFDPYTGEIGKKHIKKCDPVTYAFNPFLGEYERMTDLEKLEQKKEESLRCSLSRTKNKIYHLARSNTWEWFITLTFNPEKVDSFDFDEVTKKLSKWLNNLRSRFAPDLKYIIVPELHVSGRFHFHGLISNTGNIPFTDSGKKTHGKTVYNIGSYQLGFSTATPIESVSKSTYYITKYISKDFVCLTKGKKRYWASKNLDKASVTEFNFEAGEQFQIADAFNDVRYSKHYDLGFQTIDYIDINGFYAAGYFSGEVKAI